MTKCDSVDLLTVQLHDAGVDERRRIARRAAAEAMERLIGCLPLVSR